MGDPYVRSHGDSVKLPLAFALRVSNRLMHQESRSGRRAGTYDRLDDRGAFGAYRPA